MKTISLLKKDTLLKIINKFSKLILRLDSSSLADIFLIDFTKNLFICKTPLAEMSSQTSTTMATVKLFKHLYLEN